MSLFAHLEPAKGKAERRSSQRRKLRLEAEPDPSAESRVVIHDLSEAGMLLESSAALTVGEKLDLVIPEAGSAKASIIWSSGHYFGCRFEKPLTSAAVSAALLRSPPSPSDEERKRAIYNAVAELHSLARTVGQITDQVDRAIGEINARRGRAD
jgi:hypothetical protein